MDHIEQFYQAENWRIEDSIGWLVKSLAMTLTRELDRRVEVLGLTDAQWKPLVVLQQGIGRTAADIARLGCHDTGAVTRLLDRVESKGLIRRVRSEEDRRVVNLELTEEGQQLALEVPKILAELANQVLVGFSAGEFHQFQDLLRRALTNARALDQGENP